TPSRRLEGTYSEEEIEKILRLAAATSKRRAVELLAYTGVTRNRICTWTRPGGKYRERWLDLRRRPCKNCEETLPDDAKPHAKYCSDRCASEAVLVKRYGISGIAYRKLLADQGNKCAICSSPADTCSKGVL